MLKLESFLSSSSTSTTQFSLSSKCSSCLYLSFRNNNNSKENSFTMNETHVISDANNIEWYYQRHSTLIDQLRHNSNINQIYVSFLFKNE
jgi:hypothetical protein